tara:strand:+ start:18149 stop:19600 length:1452 start_codon:yes stop_codon:yes gene_type:complete
MSEENQIIEDVEEKDLVENQELVQDIPEEVTEDTQGTPLTQSVVDVLLSEAKKKTESEEESPEEDEDEDSVEDVEESTKKEEESPEAESEEDEEDEEEAPVEEAVKKEEDEEEEAEEDEEDVKEEASDEDEDDTDDDDSEDDSEEVVLPEVKTKAGYLAAGFDALKGMKKSQLVAAYSAINVSEEEGEVEVPKLKADIINAMYGQLKAMKKDDLMASYKAIQDSCGGMHEEKETESYAEDLKVLTDSEQELTEGFKSKVAVLFEGAVANRTIEIKESLESQYQDDLNEEIGYIRESLVTKIDDYLSYVVESWIEENQEFVDNKLRTEIAENFMKSLQGVFAEHYIEVPDSKVDLVDELSEEVTTVKESLADVEEQNKVLAGEVEKLNREKIVSEATADLASTQAAKLSSLIEEVDFVDAETFARKIATIKEGFFSNTDSTTEEVITESIDSTNVKTIVEGESDPNSKLSGDMQRYIHTLSRFK